MTARYKSVGGSVGVKQHQALAARGVFAVVLCWTSLFVLPAAAFDFLEPVEIVCKTSAVNLDTSPFQSSQGEIRLKLVPGAGDQADKSGTWSVVGHGEKHAASFTIAAKSKCAQGCPLTIGNDRNIQLWMPEPKALTQLSEDETLVLVSVGRKTLELKASSFRKKQLAGLERGKCRVVEPPQKQPAGDASSQGKTEKGDSTGSPEDKAKQRP